MNELTLEALNKRIEALEKAIGMRPELPGDNPSIIRPAPGFDWRSAIGMFTDLEFHQQVIDAGRAIREAEREETRRGTQQ